jgi:hypothetical protein
MPAETQDGGKKFNLSSHEISLATGAIALKRASKGFRSGNPVPNQGRINGEWNDACLICSELAEQSESWS